jgi:hypothetical protein
MDTTAIAPISGVTFLPTLRLGLSHLDREDHHVREELTSRKATRQIADLPLAGQHEINPWRQAFADCCPRYCAQPMLDPPQLEC